MRKTYGIAVFHHIGDVLCCTPIAKQLKADDPGCLVTFFTSTAGEVVLRHNPHIDELVVLPGDQYLLDDEIPALRSAREWTRFFTPAAYMNYGAIPGGSIETPKGTIFGIVKAGAGLTWSVPFTFPFVLTDEEKSQARAFWSRLPHGKRILVETDYRSQQSPWTDEYNFAMHEILREIDPVFIFTAKQRPPFMDRFLQIYPKAVWCDLPFRLNAELFNLCDAYVGVSSGVSCLTYSEYCRTDIPRIEVTRGEHWGAAELAHHTELSLCYSRERFLEAVYRLKLRLSDIATAPELAPRRDPHARKLTECPSCGSETGHQFRRPELLYCLSCQAVYSSAPNATVSAEQIQLDVIGAKVEAFTAAAFAEMPLEPDSRNEIFIRGRIGAAPALRETIEQAGYLLKPGGALHIGAPNGDGLLANTLNETWKHYRPDDLYVTFPRYLRELLIQAGFWIERCVTETKGEARKDLLVAIEKLRPDFTPEQRALFADEVDLRGGGDWVSIVARKRGSYQGRVRPAPELRRPTAPTQIVEVGGKEQPLVSVVVPCYNQGHLLTDAVSSVLLQTYKNWELIIVDDGSTDESLRLAENLLATDPLRRVRLVRAEHGGPAESRDLGISLSAGDWLIALDADDSLEPNFIERAIRASERGAEVVVTPLTQLGLGNGGCEAPRVSADELLTSRPIPLAPFFSKDLWLRIGGLNAGLPYGGEVLHFWFACVRENANAVAVNDTMLNTRRERSGQVHHRAYQQWRAIGALARTLHSALFSFDQLCDDHAEIARSSEDLQRQITSQIQRFPGLAFPYLWRGLIHERNGLSDRALSDYDTCERRQLDWQAPWRKLMLSAPQNSAAELEARRQDLKEKYPGIRRQT